MELRHLQWSATTCDFPGAGVYFGLALYSEHLAVARQLRTKQVRTWAGGTVSLRSDGPLFPFNYFAIRDPSAVAVKPVNRPPLANGFRHVKLAFNFERAEPSLDSEVAAQSIIEAGVRICGAGDVVTTSAFLITIGLPIAREERFFQLTVSDHPGQGWEDFYHLISALCSRENHDAH